MQQVKVNPNRVWDRIMQLGKIGATREGGVNRFAFTSEDKEAKKLIIRWMEDAGLTTWVDNAGNVFGRIEGNTKNPAILIGSHMDSVPNGGRFDGVVGVIAALEVLETINENNIKAKLPIEMVIFQNEEGSRFPGGLMGSLALIGKLKQEHIYNTKDNHGVLLRDAMIDFGIDADKVTEAKRSPSEFHTYFEIHIEQAKVLEDENIPVGIVSDIAGICQMKLIIYGGKSCHAGAVPMGNRRDPIFAAGLIIQEVERLTMESGSQTRGTIGYIKAFPGAHNIIPNKVELSIDFREIIPEVKDKILIQLNNYISKICRERELTSELIVTQDERPVIIEDKIIELFKKTARELKIPALVMPSFAAHDAMVVANLCPIGMIFIRSKNGLSHCAEEFSSKEDLEKGTQLLFNSILKVEGL